MLAMLAIFFQSPVAANIYTLLYLYNTLFFYRFNLNNSQHSQQKAKNPYFMRVAAWALSPRQIANITANTANTP